MRRPGKGLLIVMVCWLALAGLMFVAQQEPEADQIWRLYQQIYSGQITELNAEQIKQWQHLQAQSTEFLESKISSKALYLLSPHRMGRFENHSAFLIRGPQQKNVKLTSSQPMQLKISGNPTVNGTWQWQSSLTINGTQSVTLPANSQLELIHISWPATEGDLSWNGGLP